MNQGLCSWDELLESEIVRSGRPGDEKVLSVVLGVGS